MPCAGDSCGPFTALCSAQPLVFQRALQRLDLRAQEGWVVLQSLLLEHAYEMRHARQLPAISKQCAQAAMTTGRLQGSSLAGTPAYLMFPHAHRGDNAGWSVHASKQAQGEPRSSGPGLMGIAARSQAAVQKLLGMIGRSGAIYWGIVELIVMRLRDSEGLVLCLRETALCSLRSQLLMALHDANATELCNKARSRARALQLACAEIAPCCAFTSHLPVRSQCNTEPSFDVQLLES